MSKKWVYFAAGGALGFLLATAFIGGGVAVYALAHRPARAAQPAGPKPEMTMKSFVIQRPEQGAIIRLNVKIDSLRTRPNDLCLQVGDGVGARSEEAWVAKESPAGKKIFEGCRDGEWHWMTAKLRPEGRSASVVEVYDLE